VSRAPYEPPQLTYLGNLNAGLVLCAGCGRPLEESAAVKINDRPYHVECFSAGLKKTMAPLRAALEDLVVDVSNAPAPTAYRLGQESMETIVAARRKGRKRK
jgi:hypothetical protein